MTWRVVLCCAALAVLAARPVLAESNAVRACLDRMTGAEQKQCTEAVYRAATAELETLYRRAVDATYVGTWRKRFRITAGEGDIARYDDKTAVSARSFCRHCGTPLIYERARSKHMINIPRALFQNRTGRLPLYHIGIDELQDW